MRAFVTFKPGTWELQNVLAEEIKTSDDGLRIEFKLKEGVQFQKGYGELTAEDVKFSHERFLDPAWTPHKGDWEALDKVEVTGKYTGVIVLKRPSRRCGAAPCRSQRAWCCQRNTLRSLA